MRELLCALFGFLWEYCISCKNKQILCYHDKNILIAQAEILFWSTQRADSSHIFNCQKVKLPHPASYAFVRTFLVSLI